MLGIKDCGNASSFTVHAHARESDISDRLEVRTLRNTKNTSQSIDANSIQQLSDAKRVQVGLRFCILFLAQLPLKSLTMSCYKHTAGILTLLFATFVVAPATPVLKVLVSESGGNLA